MNNSNSFNICPRCGTANGLNAKYCYQCGSQLKVPEEPVVCPKCHTVNSSMANFCRTCGGTLKVGAQTKICPKCGKEVNIEENVCSCGYSFATVRYTAPVGESSVQKVDSKDLVYNRKGGRTVAIFSLIFLLLFSYLVITPAVYKPEFLKNVGMLNVLADGTALNLYDVIMFAVSKLGAISEISVSVWITMCLSAIFALAVTVQFIICIVRLFTGKKDKKANVLYLILAVLTTLAVLLMVLGQYTEIGFLKIFADGAFGIGYILYVIPAFFWFYFLFSLLAKAKRLRQPI